MSETALKFGPEWLRVLSHGGSVSSPPPSPGVNKMKRAEHRYGREEMLALFNKHQSPPDGMQALGSLYVDKAQEPLAFIPMNEEEQRMWQRGVNSDVVLRQAGRAPVNGVGRGRGGSVDRGRGRGRGTGSYYTRGLSYDEEVEPRGPKEGGPPGIGIRSKPYERSQSVHEQRLWSERAPAGTVPGVGVVPEDRNGAVSPRKEQGRASTENWRSRAGESDDSERWRGVGGNRSEKWGPRGWRERENGLEGDWEEGVGRGSTRGMPASSRGMRQPWDEKDGHFRKSWDEDNLPEWYIVRSAENSEEKGGSFDASGAFHGPGWSDEEEPTAEGRGCGPGRSRQKSSSPDEDTLALEGSGADKAEGGKREEDSEPVEEKAQKNGVEEEPQPRLSPINGMDPAQTLHPSVDSIPTEVHFFKIYGSATEESQGREESRGSPNETDQSTGIPEPMMNGVVSEEESSGREAPAAQGFQGGLGSVPVQAQNAEGPEPVPVLGREHQGEEEKLEHMRSVADDLVAKLVEEDDPRPRSNPSNPGVLPPGQMGPMPDPGPHATQTAGEDKWYYTDPQGEIQGPFSSSDMAEWYKAGYFTPSLLLRRECDDQFAQLGDLTRVFGRVPFVPGPPVPPLKVPELLAAQKQQQQQQQQQQQAERERLLLRTYMLQKQVYEQQVAASRQQVLQKLQSLEEWSTLNPIQQQQLLMQHTMTMIPAHPPIPPTVPPSTAIPQTTQVSAPIPDPRIVAGPDPRILPGPAGPPSSKPQDPIQALVAQMQTSSAASSTAMTSSCEGLLTSQLTATSMAENPLQKLLMQLQRGQQPGMGPMGGPVGALGVGLAGAGGVAAPPVATPATTVPTIEKPPEQQFDAIQSLMQQLTSMQTPSQEQMQEEQRRRDEDQKRLEEERKLLEDQKRAEEERIKMEELRLKEELKRQEEQRRSLEALRRQHEEEAQRLEEERRKIMEEQIRRQEEMRRMEEEKARKEEEQKKLKDQQMNEAKRRQEEQLRRQEEHRRQQQEQQQQQLLHQQQQQQLLQQKQQEEAAKRKEEVRRQEELRRQQQEEERKRQEEERRRQEEEEEEARQQAQIQEEMRRIALEEERRHMQQVEEEERQRQAEEEDRRHQHLLQEHLKNILPAWNAQSPVPAPEAAPAPSLADIQRAQEEKERREREVELQMQQQRQREAQRQAAEEARQKNSGLKWAAKAQANPSPAPVKSLLEIQAEEEKELKKRQEKEAAERAAAVSHMSLGAAGVWGSAISNLSWASRASTVGASAASHQSSQQWGGNSGGQSSGSGLWNNTSQPVTTTSSPGHSVWNNDHSSIWNHSDNSSSTGGFWDNPEPSKPKPASGKTPTKPNNQNHSRGGATGTQHNSANSRVSKKKGKDESDMVKKLFTENVSQADNFTQWCKSSLNTMKVHASIDIPTFVTFLAEVESPYEVHDYIRSYLGDSKEVKEFAKQYLERRSKARNAQKEREVEDDILAPAPAVNPTTSEFQEVKARSKKANKKKMQKVDSSILGFSVTSNERINVGEREYAE